MGTKFFAPKNPGFQPSNLNLESRAVSSGAYAGRSAGSNAGKDIAAAQALYKAHGFKPSQRGAAYPPGPKKV